ncbi:MAG: YccF domain-containing protein [bacterium]|nr:YccF domain-containing protein [bacterium]
MALIGNILWFIFGGGIAACVGWALVGVLLAITIVGIPFAHAAFRIAGFAAFPFGKELVDARALGEQRVTGTGLANFLWVILAGLWLAISHALTGVGYCLTIIGIPFGLAHFKLASVSFAPLGKRAVSKEVAAQLPSRGVAV